MKKLLITLIIIALFVPYIAVAETTLSGIVQADTVLSIDGSPYRAVGLQIGEGKSLNVGPGVTITGTIELYGGKLNIIGSKDNPVILNSIIKCEKFYSNIVNIEYSEINKGIEARYGSLSIKNSLIKNSRIEAEINNDCYIENNIFHGNGYIYVAMEADRVAYIRDNTFIEDKDNIYQVISGALIVNFGERNLGFTLDAIVNNNTFEIVEGFDSEILKVIGSGQMQTAGNTWNIADESPIDKFLYDLNDNLDCKYEIALQPIEELIQDPTQGQEQEPVQEETVQETQPEIIVPEQQASEEIQDEPVVETPQEIIVPEQEMIEPEQQIIDPELEEIQPASENNSEESQNEIIVDDQNQSPEIIPEPEVIQKPVEVSALEPIAEQEPEVPCIDQNQAIIEASKDQIEQDRDQLIIVHTEDPQEQDQNQPIINPLEVDQNQPIINQPKDPIKDDQNQSIIDQIIEPSNSNELQNQNQQDGQVKKEIIEESTEKAGCFISTLKL